jgi:signal transduction histidine kinase
MNYYNYFSEVEETFVRRRGKHLHLGSVDWALIESWKEMGVPLHVVINGIESAFDSYNAKPRKRSVKTLMYCQEEVEAQYAEWLESQLGAKAEDQQDTEPVADKGYDADAHLPFPRAAILQYMARSRNALEQICEERKTARRDDGLCEAIRRAVLRLCELEKDFARAARPDAEQLEDALTRLEKMLDDALNASTPEAELSAARAETEAQLHAYRDRMEKSTYEQTLSNLLLKRLRDQYGVPRLSLFYL